MTGHDYGYRVRRPIHGTHPGPSRFIAWRVEGEVMGRYADTLRRDEDLEPYWRPIFDTLRCLWERAASGEAITIIDDQGE